MVNKIQNAVYFAALMEGIYYTIITVDYLLKAILQNI